MCKERSFQSSSAPININSFIHKEMFKDDGVPDYVSNVALDAFITLLGLIVEKNQFRKWQGEIGISPGS